MTNIFRLNDQAAVHANLDILAEHGELPADSLLIFLADESARAIMAVAVDEVPPDPPQYERVRTLAPFLRKLREQVGVHGVLLVLVREGSSEIGGGDLAWHDAFTGGAQRAHLTSYGVYLVTPSGVGQVRPGARYAA